MIKIKRADCPSSLRGKKKAKAAYRNQNVVKTLWKMQHKKCAYCEAHIPIEGHIKAVEHFRPQAIFKGQVNDWENLLLACAQCNGRKSNKFPVELTNNIGEVKIVYIYKDEGNPGLLIDPSDPEIDPEDHLDFSTALSEKDYGLVVPKDNSPRGRETIAVVGLDSDYNTMTHREQIRLMMNEFLTLLTARDQGERDLEQTLTNRFQLRLSAKASFAGVARVFAKENQLDVNFRINIPNGWELA